MKILIARSFSQIVDIPDNVYRAAKAEAEENRMDPGYLSGTVIEDYLTNNEKWPNLFDAMEDDLQALVIEDPL